MSRGFHRTGKVDPGNHRKATHHRSLAGNGEAVLVIEGRILDTDGHIAVHQIGFVEIGQRRLGAAVRLLDHNRLEFSHATQPLVMIASTPTITVIDDIVLKTCMPGTSPGMKILASGYLSQAGAITGRATGFSTIGTLITAEITPNNTESHQTSSWEPLRVNATPPMSTPRKPPTW